MSSTVNVKHFANIGDIIAALAGLKRYYEITGNKIVFCQQINVRASYYEGAVHPTKDGNNNEVMCNEVMFNMIKPLILSQEYISDVQIYNGQPMGVSKDNKLLGIDLDVIRKHIFVNMPNQSLQQWIFMAYPDLAADISKSWVNVGNVDISGCRLKYKSGGLKKISKTFLKDKAIVNFTERYRNPHIDYFFLKNYKDNLIFSGTENEHQLFCEKWEIDIPYLVVNDFLQLAFIIKNSKLLLSNQSFQWNVAEAMKTPRVLELCTYAPNCQAFIGEDSYGYLSQIGCVYYFETLMSKK